MNMPGRQYSSTNDYRYGFNGKEKDNKDGIVQYDYGFRIYDPRLSRFKSVDPLTYSFPYYTPYQFAGNMPIAAIDLDGLEQYVVTYHKDLNDKTTLIEVRAIFSNEDLKSPLNQHVHKIGTTTDIAKGNVLVFEIKKLENGKESMKIIDRKDNNNLNAEEAKILKIKKANLEPESLDDSRLLYGTDVPKRPLYSSNPFDNSKTQTYSAEKGIVPSPDQSKKPESPTNKNEKKVVEVEIFTVYSEGSREAKEVVEMRQWFFKRGDGQAILKEYKADEVKLIPKIHYNATIEPTVINGASVPVLGTIKVTKTYTVPKHN